MNLEILLSKYTELFITWLPKLAMAIITLVVGLWIISRIGKIIGRILLSRDVDETVVPFLKSLVDVILKLVLLISVAGMFGIQTTSFVAILGAAGLAVGLALQGSLGHFASGVLLLVFKPYRVGDEVTLAGFSGIVTEVQVFNTVLVTEENKKIIIPNGNVTNGPIVNFTAKGTLCVHIPMYLHYSTSIQQIESVLLNIAATTQGVNTTPVPKVAVLKLDIDNLNVELRVWCNSDQHLLIRERIFSRIPAELIAAKIDLGNERPKFT